MTDTEKKTMLENMTGESDSDILVTYLTMAEEIVINRRFPYGDGTETMPEKYGSTQVEIAAFLLNKRGAEGESSHTENGITRKYDDGDIPPGLLRRITPVGEVL